MSILLLLAGYLAAVGWLAPRRLAGSAWSVRAPRSAAATWAVLALSWAVAAVMTVHVLALPGHLRARPGRWLAPTATGSPLEGAAGHHHALSLGALALAAAACVVGAGLLRAARARARHREMLDVVGRRDRARGWWVVEDERAAVWCLPGDGGRVVLTRGALERLDAEHRSAVVAHERAHLRGRHHLAVAAAKALGDALPWLPVARLMAHQVPVLVEMAADDAALRHCTPRVLAEALCVVAAGGRPGGTLAAGAHAAVQRVRRLLQPGGRLPPALALPVRLGWWAALVALPVAPVLVACGP
ncbi:M56 family metallopeptidase [Kitasatospora mediocidica]|uniref:M56 family metallopeptidase n=1 Tax=Kitasatospora mediocidica TaxID=58352 RepID=UPI00055D948C|nr:M56 family metallopeptidase [Kitasatospora mediocidica]